MIHATNDETGRLERVTTPRGTNIERLDAEMAALRETWTALDELLDATCAELPCPQLDTARLSARPASNPLRYINLPGMIALAATLVLIAAGAALWYLVPSRRAAPVARQPATASKQALAIQANTAPADGGVTDINARTTPADPALAWDDDLERPLQQAWLCAHELQDGQATIDAIHDRVAHDLSNLQLEIANENAL